MKRFGLGFLGLAMALASTNANLGDNEAKITASYGKGEKVPGITDSTSKVYEKGRYIYNVIFRNGVSVFEMYARVNQGELSPNEIATFLKANAAGAGWVAVENKGSGREWKRSDHKAKAAYFRMGGRPTLTVMEATGFKKLKH